VISVASTVVQLTGLPWDDVLWHLPAAIALQVNLLFWQREGNEFVEDDRAETHRRLMRHAG
jgi:hypothetical protein